MRNGDARAARLHTQQREAILARRHRNRARTGCKDKEAQRNCAISADFAKAFGVRRTCREWSELGSRDIGGKTRRMSVRARTAPGVRAFGVGALARECSELSLGSAPISAFENPGRLLANSFDLLRIRYGSLSASGRSYPALHVPIAPCPPFGRARRDEAPYSELYISMYLCNSG